MVNPAYVHEDWLMSFPDNEPAITGGIIVAIAGAILGVVVAFGVSITPDQQKAIMVLVAAVAPIIAAVIIRQFVWPVKKIEEVPAAAQALKAAEGKA
jgi:hypothetical protein